MTIIEFTFKTCKYNPENKVISISEKDVAKFDTSYRLWNPITKHGIVFKFHEMTGPEFDPNTKSVYASTDDSGYILVIENDAEITEKRAELYLNAKLG